MYRDRQICLRSIVGKGEYMELIYYWINEDNCIHKQGFCFSPEYDIALTQSKTVMVSETFELKIARKKKNNILSSDVISNITMVVGDNGAGKTTLLKNIFRLNCYPLKDETNEAYQQYAKQRNNRKKNLIILRDDKQLYLYTNIYKKDIRVIKEESIIIADEYVSDNNNIARNNIQDDKAYCSFTKIYISNSCFDDMNGIGSHGKLDDLVITPARLSFISNAFFEFIYPERLNRAENGAFDLYSKWLKENKRPGEFQQICDLIFYQSLIASGFISEYEGMVQTQLCLSVKSVGSIVDMESGDVSVQKANSILGLKDVLHYVGAIYDRDKAIEDPIYVLKANLIFEWYLQKKLSFTNKEKSLEEIYLQVKDDIEGSGELYFNTAVEEIRKFDGILENVQPKKNVVPKSDLTYIPGKETLEYAKADIEFKASEWKEIIEYIDARAQLNREVYEGKRKYGSFLLRYLNIDNLVFSSGERIFQNIMSWIYFLGNMDKYITKSEYDLRDDIIVCIDEIELGMHPAWQRDLIWNLRKVTNGCYKGKHVQFIMTTHSPLCLSNIPRDNTIYLKKTEKGTLVDNSIHKETFGANLYEIIDDAFYLGNNAMGRFAKTYIKKLILEIEGIGKLTDESGKIKELTDESLWDYEEKIGYIGDSLIRNKLYNRLIEKIKESQKQDIAIKAIDKEIEQLNARKRKIMEGIKSDSNNVQKEYRNRE